MATNPQTLEIVIGLPGSGKTTYLKQRLAEGAIDCYFDDYQNMAPEEDTSDPRLSPNYAGLKAAVAEGKRVAIADIRYCLDDEIARITRVIHDDFPEMTITYTYFVNDPKACRHNIRLRNRAEYLETELQFIEKHSGTYNPPQNQTIPVIMG